MKTPFVILKHRPTISITLTRDSVCAGDDCAAPHEIKIDVPSFFDPVAFTGAASSGYLPSIAGAGHSWVCLLNGKMVAEIRTGTIYPLVGELAFSERNSVHFDYRSAPC
jgi:hypothetical protein